MVGDIVSLFQSALRKLYAKKNGVEQIFVTRATPVPKEAIEKAISQHGSCIIIAITQEDTESQLAKSTDGQILPVYFWVSVISTNEFESIADLRDFFMKIGYGKNGVLCKVARQPWLLSDSVPLRIHSIALFGGGFSPNTEQIGKFYQTDQAAIAAFSLVDSP